MSRPTIHAAGLDLPLTLNVTESTQITGFGRDATYAAIERGEIHAIRVGRTIRIPTIPLLRWLGLDVQQDQITAADTSEEPPASDSSTDLTPTKDRPANDSHTSAPRSPTLRAAG